MTADVVALYVEKRGPYAELCEIYDETRDARTFTGAAPVIAHPPCGPWGPLAWRCKYQDKNAARHALRVVRRNGGVLEHPVGSQLFKEYNVPLDGSEDAYGGRVLRIRQCDWGHRAVKATYLYIVGAKEVPPLPAPYTGPTVPVQSMGKRERRLTPPALARWLVDLARSVE